MTYRNGSSVNSSTVFKNKSSHQSRTNNPKSGEVWWVENLRFENNDNKKDRPVVIVRVNRDSVDYYRCTSKTSVFEQRVPILDPIMAGLEEDTYVSQKIFSMPKNRLSRKMGELCDDDRFQLKI